MKVLEWLLKLSEVAQLTALLTYVTRKKDKNILRINQYTAWYNGICAKKTNINFKNLNKVVSGKIP